MCISSPKDEEKGSRRTGYAEEMKYGCCRAPYFIICMRILLNLRNNLVAGFKIVEFIRNDGD